MNIDTWLASASRRLSSAGIDSARLDCLILLEDLTGYERSWLLAHGEHSLSDTDRQLLNDKLEQRQRHMPLAYIRGRTEFYGRNFQVNHYVLEPRPETEIMIELFSGLRLTGRPVVIDVGTGSGALAVSSKLERPVSEVWATDIDNDCLELAAVNAMALGADVRFKLADLLRPDPPAAALPAADVILANLPYVPDDMPVNRAAGHEPALALYGGKDGLDLYRRLFDGIHLDTASGFAGPHQRPRFILTESLPFQHDGLTAVADQAGYGLQVSSGYIQLFTDYQS